MTTIDQLGDVHDGTGQYAHKLQSEPEVRLESHDLGTFLFPPANYRDVAEYKEFWTTVPISDGVLANITAGYADLIRRQQALLSVDWGHKYDNEHTNELHSPSDSIRKAAIEKRKDAYQEVLTEWYMEHPPRIKAPHARAVARAGQLSWWRRGLTDEERRDVLSSTLLVGEEEMSVKNIVSLYQLDEIRDYFQDPEVSAAERLEDLRIELRRASGL